MLCKELRQQLLVRNDRWIEANKQALIMVSNGLIRGAILLSSCIPEVARSERRWGSAVSFRVINAPLRDCTFYVPA